MVQISPQRPAVPGTFLYPPAFEALLASAKEELEVKQNPAEELLTRRGTWRRSLRHRQKGAWLDVGPVLTMCRGRRRCLTGALVGTEVWAGPASCASC